MEWDDLKLVLAIGRLGSFSAAARLTGQTQPTIGRRIRQLEARLETLLFHRGASGHTLTPAGLALFGSAEQVEDIMLAAERKASGHDARIEGIVRVTSVGFLAHEIIVPAAARLRALHPGLQIEIISDWRILDLHRREADIALRPMPFDGHDILARRAGDMVYRAYVSPHYQAGAQRMPDLLLPTEAQHPLPEIAWLLEKFPGAPVALRSDQRAVLLRAALAGLGVVSLPAIIGDATPGLRRHDEEQGPTRSLWLGLHRDIAQIPRVRAVVEGIADEVARRRKDLAGTSP
jgi:DNA-binding transcriptional LysR family regulator